MSRSSQPPLWKPVYARWSRGTWASTPISWSATSPRSTICGEPDPPPVPARAWLGAPGVHGPRLGRTFRLDPYTLQVLIDDARRAGHGARLDVVVPGSTPGAQIDAIRRRLAVLGRRGVDVRVRTLRRRRNYSFLFAV